LSCWALAAPHANPIPSAIAKATARVPVVSATITSFLPLPGDRGHRLIATERAIARMRDRPIVGSHCLLALSVDAAASPFAVQY
jgi:hypothetical protein